LQVTGEDELPFALRSLLKDPAKRLRLGDNAKKVIAKNRGATRKNLEKISEILK
jgi:3-deoxy-D-manno-octulosonic-acid transferase